MTQQPMITRAEVAACLRQLAREVEEHPAEYQEKILDDLFAFTKEVATAVGTCPLCGQHVYNWLETDGPVWTCPRDLDPNDPIQSLYWEPSDITEEQMEADGVYSRCYEDHGGYCGDHRPMHGRCYDKLFTVTEASK